MIIEKTFSRIIKPLIMNRYILILAISLLATNYTSAQKFAYVDTDYILTNIPEYAEAQQQLDDMSKSWQRQIETKKNDIDKLYKAYQAEELLLTAEMKKKREDEIVKKEQTLQQFQQDKFGVKGSLFSKRQELIQPLQDQIYNAIRDISELGNYMIVFDRAGQSGIIYSNARYDKSDDVLKKLGYSTRSK
jgi:outer membrane protein